MKSCDVRKSLVGARNIAGSRRGFLYLEAECDIALTQKIMDAAKEFAPEYDIDAIYEKVVR